MHRRAYIDQAWDDRHDGAGIRPAEHEATRPGA